MDIDPKFLPDLLDRISEENQAIRKDFFKTYGLSIEQARPIFADITEAARKYTWAEEMEERFWYYVDSGCSATGLSGDH